MRRLIVDDSGVIGSEQQIHHVLDLHPEAAMALIEALASVPEISHWWLLKSLYNEDRILYFGTVESFKSFNPMTCTVLYRETPTKKEITNDTETSS